MVNTIKVGDYTVTVTKKVKVAVAGIVALVLLLMLYTTANGIYNEGNKTEQALRAQYVDNQNYLSTYISGFYEQVGVAQTASTNLNQVLLDAVKGRYENTSAGGGGLTVNSPFFNAVVEAYPELGPAEMVKLWGKVQDYVVSGREGYRNTQSKLLDMLRGYETWRNGGLIQKNFIALLGYPSQRLEARVGANVWRGQDALDKMYQIVLTKNAQDAYDSGTLDPLQIPVPSVR